MMTKLLLPFLLLFFMLDGAGQITFKKNTTFLSQGNIPFDLKQTNDGGFVLVGTKYANNQAFGFLMKTDLHGDTTWIMHYALLSQIVNIEILNDGYLLFGRVANSGGESAVIKTDINGGVVWAKKYEAVIDQYTYSNHKIVKTNDNGFILFCGINLFKITANGDYVWGKSFVNSPINDFVLSGDDMYFAVGNTLMKLNTTGETLWKRIFKNTENLELVTLQTITSTENGIVVGGYYMDLNDNEQYKTALIKVDKVNGDLIWSKFLGDDQSRVKRLSETNDGGFLIIENSGSGNISYVFSLKTDSLGNGLFRIYSGWTAFNAIQTIDEGYAVVCSYDGDGQDYFNFIKTNSQGNIFCVNSIAFPNYSLPIISITDTSEFIFSTTFSGFANTIILQTLRLGGSSTDICSSVYLDENDFNKTFEIFPNPFTSEAKIVFNIPQTITKIQLLDVLGKELQSVSFSGIEFTIYRESLSASMYFVQITDANGKVATKKIVLE